jgi:hypothetical protein
MTNYHSQISQDKTITLELQICYSSKKNILDIHLYIHDHNYYLERYVFEDKDDSKIIYFLNLNTYTRHSTPILGALILDKDELKELLNHYDDPYFSKFFTFSYQQLMLANKLLWEDYHYPETYDYYMSLTDESFDHAFDHDR